MTFESVKDEGLDRNATGPTEEREMLDWIPLEEHYRDFGIKWTGWKYSMQTIDVVGQWVAFKKDSRTAFVVELPTMKLCALGRGDILKRGELSDGAWQLTITKAGRLQLIADGRKVLIAAIDKFVDLGVPPDSN